MNSEPIIKETLVNASVSKVWKAITDKEEMKEWYFDLKEFKPVKGFKFKFWGGTEENKYLHLCEIKEVIPERKISYSWKYEGYPGETIVIFELFPEGEKTRIQLYHKGIETFPDDNPDFAKENFIEGWNYIIGTSLKNHF